MTSLLSLSSTIISYAPVVNRQRVAIAARAHLLAPSGRGGSLADLYQEFVRISPADAPTLLLAAQGLTVGEDLLEIAPASNLWIELPAERVAEADGEALVAALHERGFRMVLAGRPLRELPAALLPAFAMSLIHVSNDRRLKDPAARLAPQTVRRSIPYAQLGVGSIDLMERCFDTGAEAIVGWPFEDTAAHSRPMSSSPEFATVARLLRLIDKGADPGEMEVLIRRDPALAYRLLRYINSAAFGLRVEIQSFRHAVMMLGMSKLKRWLMLLLATSGQQPNLRPVMFASFRRGLLLERLIGQDQEESMRDELFILGVFSFLDKLFQDSLSELLGTLSVPERVAEALIDGRGPYAPYVRIAQLVEQGPSPELPDAVEGAVLSMEQCNRAVLEALLTPDLPPD